LLYFYENRGLLVCGLDGPATYSNHNHYPIAFFIKEAIRLTDNKNSNNYVREYEREIDTLNKQWEWFSKSIPNYEFDNILPVLDISENMQKTTLMHFTPQ